MLFLLPIVSNSFRPEGETKNGKFILKCSKKLNWYKYLKIWLGDLKVELAKRISKKYHWSKFSQAEEKFAYDMK